MTMADKPSLIAKAEIDRMPEQVHAHPLDATRIRHTRALGDAAGLSTMGVHLVRLEQGNTSSVLHFHDQEEEWLYVLSGRGIAEIGDEKHEIGPGDFMGFVAGSKPHCLHNPHAEDLVYLVGGNRLPFDICNYPRVRKRRYRIDARNVFVDADDLPGSAGA